LHPLPCNDSDTNGVARREDSGYEQSSAHDAALNQRRGPLADWWHIIYYYAVNRETIYEPIALLMISFVPVLSLLTKESSPIR
jgi:hypothetical protein